MCSMPSDDFEKFKRSMNIGYEQWHDGIGYDLEALARLNSEERARALALVAERGAKDWRDVEALAALGALPRAALQSSDFQVRIRAAESLHLSKEESETLLLATLQDATIMNGLTAVLGFAQEHDTPAVRRKLLWCALNGNDDLRVHAAALVHFFYGKAASEFDWSHRPLYLRFASKVFAERESAYRDLCAEIGVDPELR
jgi:hypothetical protein